jgi:hypothetical protein
MFDLLQLELLKKFVCKILPHKNLSRSQQHLMTEAPLAELAATMQVDGRTALVLPKLRGRLPWHGQAVGLMF